MRLKKLEIRGFKTFADNTEVVFTPGITAVVGPNGSGKSNISDAIAWVMGESNVRHLRANKTEDVIFNGSAKRKAVGLAEVSLTLDNSSGSLPVGFEEITVTRRAYRSGDSEYFINKVPCRLKDIFELFLDSGAGRGAYSMVSQGEIDRLLTGKAEDRRELLEEAAGVKKYRVRRHETYRKLEHTRENLSRVDDIMQELQTQMEPLAEQAETAIRYRELTERLREIEVGLLVSRVQKLDSDISDYKLTEESITAQVAELEGVFASQTQAEADAGQAAREAQSTLETTHREFSHAQSAAERLRSDLAIAQAHRQSAEEARKRASEDIIRLEMRLAELSQQLDARAEEHSDTAQTRSGLEEEVARLKAGLHQFTQQIRQREESLAEQEASARGLAEDKAAQRSRLESNLRRRQELEAAEAVAQERLQSLAERRDTRIQDVERAESVVAAQTQNVEALSALLQELRSRHEDARENLESAQALREEASRLSIDCGSRLKMLKELEEAREGYFAGVRSVLSAARKGDLPADYAAVADILRIPADLDHALEAALGSQVQDIACSTFEDARRAIEFLKSRNLGRATFLPMDRLEDRDVWTRERWRGVNGLRGSAYELVEFDRRYDPVARLLLGRVLVAENVQFAGEAARKLRGWGKIVTLEGELLVPSGAVTGGSRVKKGAGLIERKREIAELGRELERLTDEQELAQAAVQQIKVELEELAGKLSEVQAEGEQAKVCLAQAAGERDSARASLREMDDAERETLSRLESTRAQSATIQAESAALQALLDNTGSEGSSLDEMLEHQRKELGEMQSERHRRAEEVSELSSRLSALIERENSVSRAQSQTQEEIQRATHSLEARRRELSDVESAGSLSDESLQDLAIDAEAALAAFKRAEELLAEAQAASQSAQQEHHARAMQLKDTRDLRDGLSEELHQLQISLTRSEADLAQNLERLWDEYEITRSDAMSWPEPLLIKHGTVGEVARLRKEIRAMGEVNTGAIAEFERVRERWEFLATQRTDLEEARDSLLEAIREIDDSTRDLFMNTFEQVKGNFEELFTLLFGGGVAQLELTQPDNLLETGIEVFVQPPGKKLQNMDLLSGGEKALTAQALLFALMRVRPSPFCVLDEVDAPLDDANVGRFAQLVRQFAEESQFIVITHNRATMEAADVLYGITMQEPGISSVISAKLSD
ncbi:MAG: chromosome segregation protein SMC [Armatimonadetes bacterium]|nr:chromosome segregation protein SMC [Armatimonadota bacterium]